MPPVLLHDFVDFRKQSMLWEAEHIDLRERPRLDFVRVAVWSTLFVLVLMSWGVAILLAVRLF